MELPKDYDVVRKIILKNISKDLFGQLFLNPQVVAELEQHFQFKTVE